MSLALFVLICFFLAWVEASCLAIKNTISGYDLARDDNVLWITPLAMLVIFVPGIFPMVAKRIPALFASEPNERNDVGGRNG